MSKTRLPRFFIAKTSEDDAPTAPSSPVRIVDHFITAGRHRTEAEYIVSIDINGNLTTVGEREMQESASDLQSQLAYNGVAQPMTRALAINEFYVFNVELIDRPADAPGINDPIYLYGNILGPIPGAEPPLSIPGQLTVTRADILGGILAAAPYAFHYEGSQAVRAFSRCFNILLPGGREDEIARGDSIVVAYPLPPSDLLTSDGSNELSIAQLLYDILSDIKKELAQLNGRAHRLQNQVLPVPNRAALESELEAKGYVIKGDQAVKKIGGNNKFVGMLAEAFGSSMKDKLDLPAQGSIEDLLEIARYAVETLPGWPPPQTKKLRNMCQLATPEMMERASAPKSESVFVASHGSCEAPRPQLPRKRPEEWLRDFRQPQANSSPPALPPSSSSAGSSLSAYASNSAASSPSGSKPNSSKTSSSKNNSSGSVASGAAKPVWLSDFEDLGDDSSSKNQGLTADLNNKKSAVEAGRMPALPGSGAESNRNSPPAASEAKSVSRNVEKNEKKKSKKEDDEAKSSPDWMDDFK